MLWLHGMLLQTGVSAQVHTVNACCYQKSFDECYCCLTVCMHCWQVVAASPDLFQGMAVGVGVGPTAEPLLPPLHPDLLPSQVCCGTRHLNNCTFPEIAMQLSASTANEEASRSINVQQELWCLAYLAYFQLSSD